MKTYLELEGKLTPKPQPQSQPCTSTPSHDRNSSIRKTLEPKKAEKKRRARPPVKRRYKVRVITKPIPATPTLPMNTILPAVPTPTKATSTATTQMPVVKSAAIYIPVTVYNLMQGKFEGIPNPTGRPQVEENPSAPSCNMPQQNQQPKAVSNVSIFQVREDTPWPDTVPASTNLLKARADWPIPPTKTTTVKIEKADVPTRLAAIPCTMILNKPKNNKPAEENCTWGPHCPICKKEEEGTEDWNGDRHESQQRNHYPKTFNSPSL